MRTKLPYLQQRNTRLMKHLLLALPILALGACIGTDFIDDSVPRELRIAALPDTIAFGDTVDLVATYFNEVGVEERVDILWTSADAAVFRVTPRGRGVAVATGATTLRAEATVAGQSVTEETRVVVGKETVKTVQSRRGIIKTTSTYQLTGGFTVTQTGANLLVEVAADYRASTTLPGLYLYLTNNPSTTAGAREIQKVQTFSGAHTYLIENAQLGDYSHLLYFCKPFSVKVGDGKIEE